MNLNLLKMFYTIASAGSLTKAAQILNISQSALSRHMQILEYQLKLELFKRHPRGLYLTVDGERVFNLAKRIVNESDNFIREIRDNKTDEGDLKIITTPGMASIWLSELLPNFLAEYPKIRLEVICSFLESDLNPDDSDIVIRTHIDHHLDLVQELVLESHHKMYDSSVYLKQFGEPKTVSELSNHRLIIFDRPKINNLANNHWIIDVGTSLKERREPFLILNSLEGLIHCARRGLGIIGMPKELIDLRNQDNELINILPEILGPKTDIYAIYSTKKKQSKKINLFIEYLKSMIF
ncbi:hypothetical protein IM40_03875 [Candidatus Paracaedimonas acanthamoebae]|nr:hypothetical protein IM40_03875 [Candidatus Paracaedimonas acanthamoebae]